MPTRFSGDRQSASSKRLSRYAPAASAVVCTGLMVVGFAELGGASVAPTSRSGSNSGCYSHGTTTGTATAPLLNRAGIGASRQGKSKTVTVTRTKTVTRTVTRTVTKCRTVTETLTGDGQTSTVTTTLPGETTTITVTATQAQ